MCLVLFSYSLLLHMPCLIQLSITCYAWKKHVSHHSHLLSHMWQIAEPLYAACTMIRATPGLFLPAKEATGVLVPTHVYVAWNLDVCTYLDKSMATDSFHMWPYLRNPPYTFFNTKSRRLGVFCWLPLRLSDFFCRFKSFATLFRFALFTLERNKHHLKSRMVFDQIHFLRYDINSLHKFILLYTVACNDNLRNVRCCHGRSTKQFNCVLFSTAVSEIELRIDSHRCERLFCNFPALTDAITTVSCSSV